MKKWLFIFIAVIAEIYISLIIVRAETVSIEPVSGLQGEPIRIVFFGIGDASRIKSIFVDGAALPVFSYQGIVQAVYGIDINHVTGTFPVSAILKDGTTISSTISILERKKPVLDFTIPESLGGTTPEGEKNVISLLVKENATLANLWTNPKKLWTNLFQYPVNNPAVTDPYGYSRNTGTKIITHKGTDFRALSGTAVYAVNRGVVRLVKNFSLYGKTVVVDHGQGVMSFYMHLSKISVSQGVLVKERQKIGESGETGYAEGPHLHLTIRVNKNSIDPIKFFELYGRALKQ